MFDFCTRWKYFFLEQRLYDTDVSTLFKLRSTLGWQRGANKIIFGLQQKMDTTELKPIAPSAFYGKRHKNLQYAVVD